MQTRSTGGRGWRHHSSTFCRDKRLNRLTNKKITFKGIDLSLFWSMQNFILKLTTYFVLSKAVLRSCNVYVLQTTRLTSICLLVLVYLLLLWLPIYVYSYA